jgi:hypothetical protein
MASVVRAPVMRQSPAEFLAQTRGAQEHAERNAMAGAAAGS